MKKEVATIIIIFFALVIFLGCVNSPPNPHNLRLVIESNNAPDCIKVFSDHTTMLASCETCTDFHETPILELENECEELFVSVGTSDPDPGNLIDFYTSSIASETSITAPGEKADFYIHPPDDCTIYIIQKINSQKSNPSIFEIQYRIERKSK